MDLSTTHEPIGNFLPLPANPARYRLTPEQVEHYNTHGYVAGIRMFTELAREQQSMDRMEYQFEAKLDLAGPYPSIRVKEQGVLGGATPP